MGAPSGKHSATLGEGPELGWCGGLALLGSLGSSGRLAGLARLGGITSLGTTHRGTSSALVALGTLGAIGRECGATLGEGLKLGRSGGLARLVKN